MDGAIGPDQFGKVARQQQTGLKNRISNDSTFYNRTSEYDTLKYQNCCPANGTNIALSGSHPSEELSIKELPQAVVRQFSHNEYETKPAI